MLAWVQSSSKRIGTTDVRIATDATGADRLGYHDAHAGTTKPMSGPDAVGLCARCRHARTVVTRTSTYWMCELSKSDPRFPKYPRLPVLECEGFRPVTGSSHPQAPAEGE